MITETAQPPEPPTDTSSLVELQGPYVALIDRYVRRRVPDPRQAERTVREVFQKASANSHRSRPSRFPG